MPHDESFPDTRQQSRDSYPFPLNNTSAEEVEVESKRRGKSIFQNYEILGKILERHEESIQKRWLKKSRKQRLQILLSAWPDMPPTHRPFYDYWRQVETDATVKVKHHSSILRWPAVPHERHAIDPPWRLLWRRLRVVPKVDQGTWLHLSTKDYDWPTSDIYGKKWLQNQFSTSFGMVILEIQERLMDFLVKCCHQILHGIEPDNLFSDVYLVQTEPELPLNTQTQGIQTSLLEITVETPYRVPTRLGFANLEKLFAAKVAAAEDHVWAMREDPN
ncbi:FAD-linked oxidoreductase chyH [Fusarium oxysporum f. sp. albedinis]|nr:FAD-linked oxidoreductase chyH [Fusarium oxysporum f. sp. albedinis]